MIIAFILIALISSTTTSVAIQTGNIRTVPAFTRNLNFEKFINNLKIKRILRRYYGETLALCRSNALQEDARELIALHLFSSSHEIMENPDILRGPRGRDILIRLHRRLEQSIAIPSLSVVDCRLEKTPAPELLNFLAEACGVREIFFRKVQNIAFEVLNGDEVRLIRKVSLWECGLTDFPPLFNITDLTSISLYGNQIRILTGDEYHRANGVRKMAKVTDVGLEGNPIARIAADFIEVIPLKASLAFQGGYFADAKIVDVTLIELLRGRYAAIFFG